jgi:hypothetical protein
MQQAISVIKEFVSDVESIGGGPMLDSVLFGKGDESEGWPDLKYTYGRAVQFLKDAGHGEKEDGANNQSAPEGAEGE